MLAVREEPELVGGRRRRNPPAAKREIEPRARDIDAEAPEIGRVPQQGPATVADQRVGRLGADARHADQELARRPQDLEREILGMRERPGRLGIVVERQVAVAAEGQLVEAEAVLAEQVLGLIEAKLPDRRRRRRVLHWRADHRLERTEVGVVQKAFALEPRDHAEDLSIALTGGADHELRRRTRLRPG